MTNNISVEVGETLTDEEIAQIELCYRSSEEEKDAPFAFAVNDRPVVSTSIVEYGDPIEPFELVQGQIDSDYVETVEAAAMRKPDIWGYTTWRINGKQNSSVSIRLARVPNTGGHFHGGYSTDKRVVGWADPTHIQLKGAYPQNATAVVYHTKIGGSKLTIFRFDDHGKVTTHVSRFDLTMTKSLVQIATSANLKLKAPRAAHPSPYWVSEEFRDALTKLANGYAARTSGRHITITEGCLQFGGTFDYKNMDWSPPHKTHQWGRSADVRNFDQSLAQRIIFAEEAVKAGLVPVDEGNHWHLKLP
jgi:hypothetical protein